MGIPVVLSHITEIFLNPVYATLSMTIPALRESYISKKCNCTVCSMGLFTKQEYNFHKSLNGLK